MNEIMKRLFAISLVTFAFALAAQAQSVAFVKTDSLLKSLPDYTAAQKTLSAKADGLRAELENDLKAIDELYNSYQSQKQYLSSSSRAAAENRIITMEDALKEKQESYFGEDGQMARATATLLAPIRKKVDAAIKAYSVEHGCVMVVDLSAGASIVYYNPAADITDKIIKILNNN